MFVHDFDYNPDGELKTGTLIRKKHFENYFKAKVAVVNPERIKSFSDLSKLLN